MGKIKEFLKPFLVPIRDEVINKINEQYAGEISERDKVMMSDLHDRLIKDKKLQTAAINNGQQMFTNNVFPNIFNNTAQQAYIESKETYEQMFKDAEKYHVYMNALSAVVYNELRQMLK